MRARSGTIHSKRRKKIMKRVKGFRGGRRKLYKTAKDAVLKAGQWAFRDRKQKKRHMRALWITRINAACRLNGMSYSMFIYGLKQAKIDLNRKQLSELAINDPETFNTILLIAKEKAAKKAA